MTGYQLALNQSVLVLGYPTLPMQISKLSEHFHVIVRTTVIFAKPCSQPEQRPHANAADQHHQTPLPRCETPAELSHLFPIYFDRQHDQRPPPRCVSSSQTVAMSRGRIMAVDLCRASCVVVNAEPSPFQGRRVGPARFERRPTLGNRREIMVGRRGEAPLFPPDSLSNRNWAMAQSSTLLRQSSIRAKAWFAERT